MMADALFAAMTQAGWHYDDATDGFVFKEMWVSRGQAETALAAAQQGKQGVPNVPPQSKTLAKIITGAVNDDGRVVANDQ